MNKTRLAGLVLAALLTVSCKSTVEAPPSDSSSPKGSAPVAASGSGSSNVLDSVMRALDGVRSFRARMTISGTREGAIESKIDYVLPDRIRMTSDQFEMVMIGATNYMKTRGGQWMKMEMQTPFNFTSLKKLSDDLKATTDVKSVGTEVLDGATTQVYQYTSTMPPRPGTIESSPITYIAKVWIGEDGLPRKLEGQELNGEAKTTIIYYDYNANITIEPPIK